jgi:GntR family transcriptional regulator
MDGERPARIDVDIAQHAPVDQLDNQLLGLRARAAILKAIFEGRFESNKLPNEDRLAEMLNVSRTTVRTALQGLERDGVVTRQRAIGTIINPHVRPSALALQRLIGFDGLLRERGHEVDVEISAKWGTAGDRFADFFALEPDLECLLIDKAYRADDTLALAIVDAVPREQITNEDAAGDVEPSLFTFSRRYCRTPIHHAVVRLAPMIKDGDDTHLDLAPGTPFLRLYETHYSARGEQVASSIIDIDDSFIQLEVVRTQ